MTDPTSAFAKMVPGFDFLQGLVKNAGAAMPGVGQWIAPTLDPEELDKRINDLRTVQFWLEQNARMLGATIQALEVQRMTLSTLKTMNVSFGDLTESLKIRMPAQAREPVDQAPAPAPEPAPAPAPAAAAPEVPAGVIDPMQWWGALTQQFTQLAANAMQDGATDNARNLAGNLVKQGLDAASETFRQAAAMPAAVAKTAGAAAQKLGGLQPSAAPAPSAKAAKPAPARKAASRARPRPATRGSGKTR
ncbi:MAG: PhaM family polyhydroxyalkanoate granule multifunctional regulatory protein [Pseudomonadota bacterium]